MRRKFRHFPEESSFEEPTINLTPLIDVVFVVLISFMLIAPMLDIDPVDLSVSSGAEKKEVKAGPISISVHADDTIWIHGKKVTLVELEAILKQEKKKYPKVTPQLAHDKKAHFGTYQALKNTLESVGFEQVDIVLKPG